LTPGTNPWNTVYKLASNKTKSSQTFKTLQKPDVPLTSDLNEIVKVIIDYLIPKDEHLDDKQYHKRIRAQSKNPF